MFSEKINYALSAIFELAKNEFKGYIQIKEIADAQNIPQKFLEKLLINLKRAGLVESMRGAQGGYKLAKPARKIKVIDILRGIEGTISLLDYSKNSIVLQGFWKEVESKFQKLFEKNIENLVQEDKRIQNKLSFQI
ncbi:MAG: RrF2 family transcriptional regulator [Promethearchaeota archaeon]